MPTTVTTAPISITPATSAWGGRIQSLEVSNLFGRYTYHFDAFRDDFNIFTGSNGTGKTTLLKLMWYMISGNVRQALLEIEFAEARLVTKAGVSVQLRKRPARATDARRDGSPIILGSMVCEVHIIKRDGSNIFSRFPIPFDELESELQAKGPAMNTTSLFMPVFRRLGTGLRTSEVNLDGQLQRLIELLSHDPHFFVASGNQKDLTNAYSQLYRVAAEQSLPIEQHRNHEITRLLASNPADLNAQISQLMENAQTQLDQIRLPINELARYVDYLFWDKSILIPNTGDIQSGIVVGTHPRRVSIEHLSSGEENLFSLLVYNAVYRDALIFVDEPELYMHPDWQRELIRVLKEQNPTNQFYFATHSADIAASFRPGLIRLDEQLREQGLEL
jgi:predicted ATP-binding protein involved in virulence